jgi:hypothetical protein
MKKLYKADFFTIYFIENDTKSSSSVFPKYLIIICNH